MNKTEVKINGKIAVEIKINGGLFWRKGGDAFKYDYAVLQTLADKEDNLQYQYNREDGKWYCLNNLGELEPYGVLEEVASLDDATYYNGKLVAVGDSEYEWTNGQWDYLGEKEGGFGQVGYISQEDLRETNFPTDFYITTEDIEKSGWFYLNMSMENGNLSVNGSIGSFNYRISDYDQGGDFRGTAEVEEIDGVQYVHFSCPDYPSDSVFVRDCMWWNEPLAYYGSSIVYPKQYEKITYNTKDGYYYDTEDDITAPFGKNIVYNIDGYLYKNVYGTYERGNNGNPYLENAFKDDDKMKGDIKLLDEVIDSIGNSTFYGCSGLTSVTIGDSVTSIGIEVFRDCSSLTSVEIPDSVTSIGGSTFSGCTSLTSIEIPDSVTMIGATTFYGCSSLTSVEIPDSVTSIGGRAFSGCTSLTSIEIPDSVTSIGDYAFNNCTSLTSVEIPNSVTSIGNYAFSGCTSLTSIIIGESVTSIGYYAFSGCVNLASITFNGITAPKYMAQYIQNHPFGTIRTSSTGGANYAGYNVTNPTIYYPSGASGYNSNGVGTSWLYIASRSKTSSATYYYGSTTSDKTTAYGYGWSAKSYIGTVTYTYTDGTTETKEVTSASFSYNGSGEKNTLASVDLTNAKITSISNSAFVSCSSLTSVEIPNSVTSIGNYAFSGCSNLTSVVIPDSVTSIGENTFGNCSKLTSVVIPDSVTSIGISAFQGCTNLSSIDIPNSVTSIGNMAFDGCSGLTSVTLGDSVTSIGSSAFSNCSKLTSVVIPDSVTSISGNAFKLCTSLTSVIIGNSVTSIGDNAFTNCIGLTSIEIPDSVTSIGYSAFYGCRSLTSIEIPDSVTTSIDSSTFSGCSGLTSVIIGNSVTSIGSYAFYKCSGLTSVTIGNSVTSISTEAFSGCYSLTSLTIPNSVTFIGEYAFSNAPSQGTLYCNKAWYEGLTSTMIKRLGNVYNWVKVWTGDEPTITKNYLRFDAATNDVHIGFNDLSLATSMEYSTGNEDEFVAFPSEGVDIPQGKSIWLKADGLNTQQNNRTFTTSDNVECHGDARSLLSKTDFENATITNCCFMGLFKDSKITTAPELPAMELAFECYSKMFQNCTELTEAPELPATDLTNQDTTYCYGYMFAGCTALTEAPVLPATDLSDSCYGWMFDGCTALTEAPELHALNLGPQCYANMFKGCTALTEAPALPATELKARCYSNMFNGCTSLTKAPALSATTLVRNCYDSMFKGCTALTEAPELPAETIDSGDSDYDNSYHQMFYNCSSLHAVKCNARYISRGTTVSEITSTIALSWLSGVAETGRFYKNPDWSGQVTWRGGDSIPKNWEIVDWGDNFGGDGGDAGVGDWD